ncbi:hypothetical protein [Paraburkholderia tuberum]|uniref:Uncharacterized protein n=1 Tax=Paraburkholderia tuberum TaxID=157910 RepID=A0A1H1GXZ7_9BURK|nr:hypothetical protein [Paraburkholderia tuberum]SDR17983.1 hypothetical protein SAMN05445850_3147 [Paraburkholderia tuberum]
MEAKQFPTLMPVPFAQHGQRNDIPQQSQIGTTKGAASLVDGFPPLTMTDPLKGGIPPFGKDVNGILYLLALTARWAQLGGSFTYNGSFANDPNVGGYPQGAVLLRADLSGFWFNLADNNTTDPDAADGSARNWLSLNPDWDAQSGPGQILNRPNLAKVATSGSFDDLEDQPDIPAAQVNADWGAEDGIAKILNKPRLAKVATSGEFGDLEGLPETVVVNLNPGASVTLDLTPIADGNPEILFNLTVAVGATTTISLANPPAAGVLAAFLLVVNNSLGSAIVWPSNINWPQGIAPSLTGTAGKFDTFVIFTQDGGVTYSGFVAGQNQ